MRFGEDYKQYLKSAKTEREFVLASVALAQKNGFSDLAERIENNQPLLAGEKFYYAHQHKCVMLFVMGTEPMNRGMNITAHISILPVWI
jgi:aspartyl aminopeptidase